MPTECYRPAVMRSARNLLSLALALVALGCSDDSSDESVRCLTDAELEG